MILLVEFMRRNSISFPSPTGLSCPAGRMKVRARRKIRSARTLDSRSRRCSTSCIHAVVTPTLSREEKKQTLHIEDKSAPLAIAKNYWLYTNRHLKLKKDLRATAECFVAHIEKGGAP
jgi:hypothetical protein